MVDATAARRAVLVIGFNRAAHLRRVLETVRAAGPPRVYIALDGPRPGNGADVAACAAARAVAQASDAHLLLQDVNLGCGAGMAAALDWFFEHEDDGLVLEDDCVPDASFFPFCEHLLSEYRDAYDIWMVTGNNLLTAYNETFGDYFFSDGGVWGWATWRDRWQRRGDTLADLQDPGKVATARRMLGEQEWRRVEPLLRAAAQGRLDTWDYQWLFARVARGGLAIVPTRNLVTNVGFGREATHTTQRSRLAGLPTTSANLPPRTSAPLNMDLGYISARAAMEAPTGGQRLRGRGRRLLTGLGRR